MKCVVFDRCRSDPEIYVPRSRPVGEWQTTEDALVETTVTSLVEAALC